MSAQTIYQNKYNELRSAYKYYIDSYDALYQLKTENEEELNKIYIMIKTDLIDSKIYLPQNLIKDILNIIPYNNRYVKSYLYLAKLIYDDFHVEDVRKVELISFYLFYKEYGIKLNNSDNFEKYNFGKLDIHSEDTIYRAIMYNDKERFILSTERDDFDKNQKLKSDLYPYSHVGYSLLELCCYHGAVDCFKLLRTKFNSEITQECLQFSFLGGNPEIISECLKYQTPDRFCMEYAIISRNIDFVTFLMNEYNIEIKLHFCARYNNLDSFFVYFDQTNNVNKCFIKSGAFGILSLCKYFLSLGANINAKDENGETALFNAAMISQEIVEFLLSQGISINEENIIGETALHRAMYNGKLFQFLVSHGGRTRLDPRYRPNPPHRRRLRISHDSKK
ncbi:hypothetical protein TVAG_360880 [Trichomonas vaginalis G3]|uniref:DUF3447 domain-containing protein n=1 Tax=Trichomonas vaginalis (strain ATCC PRA-98 / G3) TaxID=412133 RepID=A2FGP5_TRIV3|nr:protein of unknown function (DUF3447) [Trichomonas vaginalis G3]EAX95927.1 hypothetical protein TVAG_360880 [Trichomonas vaginalis G3]KAI5540143.1 protein of unknown function (DUF3447) [Trichomonas vaginalis G3]|eukprot:XP_001308857.1 hypothetical protein [Trichomonas vaginalis G3]